MIQRFSLALLLLSISGCGAFHQLHRPQRKAAAKIPFARAGYFQRTSIFSTKREEEQDEKKTDQALDDTFIKKGIEAFDPSSLVDAPNKEETKPVLTDDDFVFVGNSDQMLHDPVLKQMASELSVWKEFGRQDNEYWPLDVILERAWDTAEDIYLHLRRKVQEGQGEIKLTKEEDASRKTVVVLGSGWGAHALMKVCDCFKIRLIVVSPTNHFVFTPMLSSAATGTVHYRSMTEAVRSSNPLLHEYIEGKATQVDVLNKSVNVELKHGKKLINLAYDHLVVAVGSQVFDFNTPGVKEHAYKLKSIDDARRIRTAVGECFEQASSPTMAGTSEETEKERSRQVTFLIAGAGPTGVEVAGELSDLFRDVTRPLKGPYRKLANATRVILVEGGPVVLPPFNDRMRAEALRTLKNQGVEVHLNTFVTKVTDKSVTLSAQQFDPETGEPLKERKEMEVPVGLTIWAAGTKPVPFVDHLLEQLPPEAKNPRDGRVKVDRWMRPVMPTPELFGSILVLGDAAAQSSGDAEERLLPPTAQVAAQQGAYVARNLNRNYNLAERPPRVMETSSANNTDNVFDDPALANWLKFRGLEIAPPFHFLNLGILAYLGSGEALSQIHVGEQNVMNKSGAIGYFLFRSVYLVKQVATRNRVLVTFDLIMTRIFGRDMTRF